MDVLIVFILAISFLMNSLTLYKLKSIDSKLLGSTLEDFEPLDSAFIGGLDFIVPPKTEEAPIEPPVSVQQEPKAAEKSYSAWRNQTEISHTIASPSQHDPLPTAKPQERPYGFT